MRYVYDEYGNKTDVIVPIEIWETLCLFKEFGYAEDVTEEEIANADTAWEEYKSGKVQGISLDELKKSLRDDRSE